MIVEKNTKQWLVLTPYITLIILGFISSFILYDPLTAIEFVILLVIAFVLSIFTFKFVEIKEDESNV